MCSGMSAGSESRPMVSATIPAHSLQMATPGPVTTIRMSLWFVVSSPQNEQRLISRLASRPTGLARRTEESRPDLEAPWVGESWGNGLQRCRSESLRHENAKHQPAVRRARRVAAGGDVSQLEPL